jgi:hypothetical protein
MNRRIYLGGPSFGVEPPYFPVSSGGSGGEQLVGRLWQVPDSIRRFYAWIPDKKYEHRCVALQWVDFRLADRIRDVMSPDAGLVFLKTLEMMRGFNPRGFLRKRANALRRATPRSASRRRK